MKPLQTITEEELIALIEQVVERKLALGQLHQRARSLEEVFASVKQHRWTPPPDAPSPEQLVRASRDNQFTNPSWIK